MGAQQEVGARHESRRLSIRLIARNESGRLYIKDLSNLGVVPRQLLCPANSTSERVTMTEVHLQPGAMQPRHAHATSEQIWYALRGEGALLLGDGAERAFSAGDIVRFEDGDVHGLRNDSPSEFVYLSVTAPLIGFGYAYRAQTRDVGR